MTLAGLGDLQGKPGRVKRMGWWWVRWWVICWSWWGKSWVVSFSGSGSVVRRWGRSWVRMAWAVSVMGVVVGGVVAVMGVVAFV